MIRLALWKIMQGTVNISSSLFSTLATECAEQGFEICHAFDTGWYNAQIQKEGLLESGQLKCLPSSNEAYLMGNTNSIWPRFCDWLVEQYQLYQQQQKGNEHVEAENEANDEKEAQYPMNQFLQNLKDPLDTFCEQRLTCLFHKHFPDRRYDIYWDHAGGKKSENDNCHHSSNSSSSSTTKQHWNSDFMVCMSRVAQVSGLCWNDQHATKLCIHPQFGTWHAYRAILVLRDGNGNLSTTTRPPPAQVPCPVPSKELAMAECQMQVAVQLVCKISDTDDSGGSHNNDMMERAKSALRKELHDSSSKAIHNGIEDDDDGSLLNVQVSPSTQAWMDLRDCISLGRDEYKYSEAQLLYHYTRDPIILKHEVGKRCCS